MRRHIDFIAVFFIAAVMAAFSQAPSLRFPSAVNRVRLHNASNTAPCPLSREVFASLADFLEQ